MKFTLSWLKKFLDTTASLDEIIKTLTNIGLEVEEVIDRKNELNSFTVAYIIEAVKHPNADSLKVCKVQTKDSVLQIVCGAFNARAGIKVVLASVGCIIPNGNFKIKASKIRDVESNGMLCSADELMVDGDSSGIIELNEDAIVGDKFIDNYPGLNDPIIDLSITPNRSDALGVYGIARDLAAAGLGKLKTLDIIKSEMQYYDVDIKNKIDANIQINIKDKDISSLFAMARINNICNQESPIWLKTLLNSIGIRSISSIVDIANYIMISFNQPMHVYDADKIPNDQTIEVKLLTDTENFTALNDNTYECIKDDIVICSDNKILSLAGIIGSSSSACDLNTKNIILESAVFNHQYITQTGRRLMINTDARYRFERKIDQSMTITALEFAICMIHQICGGDVSNIISSKQEEENVKVIDFNIDFSKQYTGLNLSTESITDILQNLGFQIKEVNNNIIKVRVPSWRHDISIKEDIVQEILRIYGYDKIIPIKLQEIDAKPGQVVNNMQKRLYSLRRILSSIGYDEVVTWSFSNSKNVSLFHNLNDSLLIKNPISKMLDYMRPSILPNLLDIVMQNGARGFNDMGIFEIGPVFEGINPSDEKINITGIKCGVNIIKNCHEKSRVVDVYDIKSDLNVIFDYLDLPMNSLKLNTQNLPKYYHPTRSASLMLGKNIIGYLGQVHPLILKHYDIKNDVVCFEINWSNIPELKQKFGKRSEFKISNFQANTRDYAFIIDKDKPIGQIIDCIMNIDKNLIKSVDLFDIYLSDKLGHDKKSIALSVNIQANDRTLVEEELSLIDNKIIGTLQSNFNAQIRE